MFDQAIDLHLRHVTENDHRPRARVKADQLIGTVDWFDAKLGYGFIGTDQGDFYVHISAVERARRNGLLRDYLQEGQTVQFDLEPDKFGKRQKAINIRLAA